MQLKHGVRDLSDRNERQRRDLKMDRLINNEHGTVVGRIITCFTGNPHPWITALLWYLSGIENSLHTQWLSSDSVFGRGPVTIFNHSRLLGNLRTASQHLTTAFCNKVKRSDCKSSHGCPTIPQKVCRFVLLLVVCCVSGSKERKAGQTTVNNVESTAVNKLHRSTTHFYSSFMSQLPGDHYWGLFENLSLIEDKYIQQEILGICYSLQEPSSKTSLGARNSIPHPNKIL